MKKGIILAGGEGTRLLPLTKIINKHLLPVGKYPMIYHAIQKFKDSNITEILIITNKKALPLLVEFFGNGMEFNINITYKIQNNSDGIADALLQAEGFITKGEKFVVLLGDNIFKDSLQPFIADFSKQKNGAKVLLKKVDHLEQFGVPIIKNEIITYIEEKPLQPKSSYCVTGIYMYDHEVFNVIKTISPSLRGELEITDVNNHYARNNLLTYNILSDWWYDAGTFNALYECNSKFKV